MRTKLLSLCVCALGILALGACAAPTPTATPVAPTPTAVPPTSTPTLPTPTPRSLPQATIRLGNLDRTYLYYVPANLPRNAPLVFVLHMNHQDAEGIRRVTEYAFEMLADQNGFIVVYPNGYSRNWNDCRKYDSVRQVAPNLDDVDFIRVLNARFRADYDINSSRVFAVGLSIGGQMALRLALEIPDEFTAIAAVAAGLPSDSNTVCRASGKPISVLMMNGTSDSFVPYKGNPLVYLSSQASSEYFAKLNGQINPPNTTRLPDQDPSDPTSVDQTVWNDTGKPEVVLFTINGGGHAFPKGKFSTMTYLGNNVGQATGDLDGPAVVWEFFARQESPKSVGAEVPATKN